MDSCMRALSQRPWAVGFEVFAVERSSTRRRDAETQRRRDAERRIRREAGPVLRSQGRQDFGWEAAPETETDEREREKSAVQRVRVASLAPRPLRAVLGHGVDVLARQLASERARASASLGPPEWPQSGR